MRTYIKPILSVLLGLWITNVGVQMACATFTRTTDTRSGNALIGAGIGAGGGIVTGLIVGGIGVATGGAAFAIGLPLMAILGAGGGALAGAATGKVVVQSGPLYSPLAWGAVIFVGVVISLRGMRQFMVLKRKHGAALSDSHGQMD